jgi:signal transduction histidine kinase
VRLSLTLKYVVSTTLILLVVIGVTLGLIARRHEQLVMEQIEMQAKGLFQQIVITRRWVADHGGVFVEKLPWVEPNPYLPNSSITDVSGKQYIRENPALVTRRLSMYAEREGLYFFHITSLKPVNPANAPDAFERQALEDFAASRRKEASGIDRAGGSARFRYIAPLYIEAACLSCHATQGYQVGEVRGAISVSLPMDYAVSMMATDRKYMILGASATVIVVMLGLFGVTRHTVINPINRMRAVMHRFSTDGNPDVPVLRTGDELEDLSTSFRDMARAVDESHARLQEKISAATTELTATNATLLALNRDKSEFIARISHELRTPLTSIKGAMDYVSARLAAERRADHEDLAVFLEMVTNNADRLVRLVNNALDYERMELGQLDIDLSEVSLRDAFLEVVTNFRPLSDAKDVRIELDAADVQAAVDEDRLKQVLTNLLSNALHFSPAGSTITVTLRDDGDAIEAAVEDRGPGVPEEEREKIFLQYYTRGVRNGTGLGLAISRRLIEAHGGTIGIERGDGGGSRFWFRIPKTRRHVADESAVARGR